MLAAVLMPGLEMLTSCSSNGDNTVGGSISKGMEKCNG